MTKRDEYPNLAFYILSLIFSKNYNTDEKLIDIIKTSFACERGMIHIDKINKTIARLISFKFIEKMIMFTILLKLDLYHVIILLILMICFLIK